MDITSYLLGKKAGGGSPTPPKLQEKSVTVTSNGTQDITADSGYDGLDKVELTTNVVPSLQTKNITISSNGTQTVVNDIAYDGLDEVNITTNVTPNNQSKSLTITENTTTTISSDLGYDGLSEVEITTNVSGGGASEYFEDVLPSNFQDAYCGAWTKCVKNIDFNISPDRTNLKFFWEGYNGTNLDLSNWNTSNITNCQSCFVNCSNLTNLDLSNWNTLNITNTYFMFKGCSKLKSIDFSSWTKGVNFTTCGGMFMGCSSLELIDIRNFEFDNNMTSTDLFTGIPDNCLIIVKNQTQKDWITSNFSRLTNVKTVDEL